MDDKIKCACEHCTCMVETETAIKKNGSFYCDESCANGHVEKVGCGHENCNCS